MSRTELNCVIFAAGVGSRLAATQPKAMLKIAGLPIFAHQLKILQDFDVRIYFVCGYKASSFCDLVLSTVESGACCVNQLSFIYNPNYRNPQIESIKRALDCIPSDQDALFIDGDMLFSRKSITSILAADRSAVLVRNDISADAVVAETDGNVLRGFSRRGKGSLEWANVAKYKSVDLRRLRAITYDSGAVHHFETINSLAAVSEIQVVTGEVAEVDELGDIPLAELFCGNHLYD